MSEQERTEKVLRDIGKMLKDSMPEGVGYTLMVFTFGDGGWMTYLSTAQRKDMIASMRDLIAKLERETLPGGSS